MRKLIKFLVCAVCAGFVMMMTTVCYPDQGEEIKFFIDVTYINGSHINETIKFTANMENKGVTVKPGGMGKGVLTVTGLVSSGRKHVSITAQVINDSNGNKPPEHKMYDVKIPDDGNRAKLTVVYPFH